MEALENRVVLTQVAYGLFDTGVDGSGNALAVGQPDSHYILSANPNGTAGANAVVTSTVGGWAANSSTDAWIAPDSSQGGLASGSYTYETTFDVNSAGQAQFTGMLAGDDYIHDVLIDGVSTGYNQPQAGTAFVPFNVAGAVVAGTNTLDFVVPNSSGGTTGFHAQGLTLDYIPTVAVSSPTVAVGYGGTATLTGTFNDLDAGDTVTITSTRGSISTVGTNSGTFTYTESNVTTGGPVTITATDNHGALTTVGFQLNVAPPSLTAGGGTATATAGGAAVAVDPNVTLDDPNGPNFSSASISIGTNFTASEDRLLFTSQNGITGSYNTSTGILTLSGSATPAQYQAALRSVAYEDINANPATVNQAARTVSFSIAPGTFNPANGHFYNFVHNPGITWTNAKAAADATSLYGMKGYLATLTSAAENTFAFSKTLSTGWIGASDAGNVGHWAWADGPENGLQFWQGLQNGAPVNGQYNDWNSGEPNDSGGTEFYAQYLASGLWNDLSNTASVNGYLIEYGGSTGDPTLQLTSQASVKVVAITGTPTLTSPSGPTTVNTATFAIQGNATAGSLVQVYADTNGDGMIDDGEQVIGSEQLAPAATSYLVDVPLTSLVADNFLVTATAAPEVESLPAVVPPLTYIPPPVLTGGNVPITARSGGAAVPVDPNLTIVDYGPNLTTASVSIGTNFTPAEDRLLFTDQGGITGSYNASSGILTLSGSATPAQYQAALRTVQYQNINTNPGSVNQAPRSISFSIAPGTYNATNGHFYDFVPALNITWTDAKAAADAMTVYGLKGYLATITSAAEDTFAFSKIQATGWIGSSDAASEGQWEWVDGPEAGLQFWQGAVNGAPVNGQYTNWGPNQPDNAGGNENSRPVRRAGEVERPPRFRPLRRPLRPDPGLSRRVRRFGGRPDSATDLGGHGRRHRRDRHPGGLQPGRRRHGQRPEFHRPGHGRPRQPRANLR